MNKNTQPETAAPEPEESAQRATYNITNDKLKVWFDNRLSAEDYTTCKGAGFTYWHGSKCFAAKWSTQAEDFILSRGIAIDDDDTPDDVESRVERFEKYADRAAESAERSQEYLEERANTEKRKQNAVNAISRGLGEAEHWQERIEGAIRHAAYRENPGVIARRISKLEASERKFQKELDKFGACQRNWQKISAETDVEKQNRFALYVAGKSSCTPYGTWSDIDKGMITGAEAATRTLAYCESELTRYGRWLAHTGKRLLYERASLEAAGGLASENGLEKGGAIKTASHINHGNWSLITKINKTTVEVYDPYCTWRKFWKVEKTCVKETATKAQVDAGEVSVTRPEVAA